jgi:hypothetical protein
LPSIVRTTTVPENLRSRASGIFMLSVFSKRDVGGALIEDAPMGTAGWAETAGSMERAHSS